MTVTNAKGAKRVKRNPAAVKPIPLSEIQPLDEPRIHMPSEELNRVLGGGLYIFFLEKSLIVSFLAANITLYC